MPYNHPHFPDFLAGPPRPPIGPEEGPWYDRAAPDNDDQLAIFSRVGRGIKGDGYKVIINQDSDMETYLQGMSFDEASGTWASEWISENINGGRLDYQYNLRPYTIPQTFTITFRYRRPNRDPYQWTWTTPAIPYIWDADDNGNADVDGIVGVGAASLFLKKTQDAWLTTNLPTSHTIEQALTRQEKLLYPESWTREDLNAPIPGDPYTVNLTYGIGGDFDAPNIEDLARILGMTVPHIRYLVANHALPTSDPLNTNENLREYVDRRDAEDMNHIHQDMGFGDHLLTDDNDFDNMTIKKYIDNMINNVAITSVDGQLLKVTRTVKNHTIGDNDFSWGVDFSLDPINPVAGSGIKLTNNGSTLRIDNNIIAGPGIQISRNANGSITISNSQIGDGWVTLVAGRDFVYKYHNGWWGGPGQSEAINTSPSASDIQPPVVKALASYDLDGNITGAEIKFDFNGSTRLVNKYNLIEKSNGEYTRFFLRHGRTLAQAPLSAILSIQFMGDWADLNNLNVKNVLSIGSNIWNVEANSDPTSASGWVNCGACWQVNCNCVENAGSPYYKFCMTAVNIADGYNSQFDTPGYGQSKLYIHGWANFDWQLVLG